MQQRREDGPIPLPLEGLGLGETQEGARLRICDRRRLPLIALDLRPLDPLHRIVRHSIGLAQVLEDRGERGELPPDRRPGELPPPQVLAPCNDMRPRHAPKLLCLHDPHEPHELVEVSPVRTPCPRVVDVGKPLDLRRHRPELLKLPRGEHARTLAHHNPPLLSSHRSSRRALALRLFWMLAHPLMLLLITYFIKSSYPQGRRVESYRRLSLGLGGGILQAPWPNHALLVGPR